jgi:hypothetical protein
VTMRPASVMLMEMNSKYESQSSRRLPFMALYGVLGALSLCASASAQYAYDPRNLDEQGPGIKYFGSVKNDKGSLLKGAIVLIEHQYLAVTDDQGRFRVNLPETLPGDKVDVSCSNPGYQTILVTKRLGPHGPKQTVQVDCVMRIAK